MTKEELLNKRTHSMTMKDLREFVLKNQELEDDAPVLVERIIDSYFEPREFNGEMTKGWDVLKVEGYHYHQTLRLNEDMLEEIELRKQGNSEYDKIENPLDYISGEEELEQMKEQFHQAHCITTDEEIVYIYSHY